MRNLSMSKRRRSTARQGAARWLWGARGVRLLDAVGVEYEPSEVELSRKDIDAILRARELPVAVHSCGDGVHWHSAAEGREAWAGVSADFEDIEDWRPPSNASGMQQYRAEVWRGSTGEARVLVLRND